MKWETMSKEQKQYAILGGVGGLALIYVLYTVLSSLLAAPADKNAETVDPDTLESNVQAAERTLKKERPIMREYEDGLAYLDEVRKYFPNEDNRYSWVTELIYTQGRNFGIEVESINELGRQEAAVTVPPFTRYAVQVNLRCRYDRLVAFIKHCEEDNPMMRITQLTINSDENDPVNHTVKVVMEWPTSLDVQRVP